MEGDPAAYTLMKSIVNLFTNSDGISWWFVPVFMIYTVLKVINWAYRKSRGERLDDIMESGTASVEALRGQPERVREAWRSRFR